MQLENIPMQVALTRKGAHVSNRRNPTTHSTYLTRNSDPVLATILCIAISLGTCNQLTDCFDDLLRGSRHSRSIGVVAT
jgi:hypothetical protein